MSLQLANNELVMIRAEDDSTDYGGGDGTDPLEFGEDAVSNNLRIGDTEAGGSGNASDVYFQDIKDLSIEPEGISDTPDRVTWSADSSKSPFIKHMASFELELALTPHVTVGAKSNNNLPAYNDVLRAMNLSEDTSTSSTPVYTPSTSRVTSITIYQIIRNATDDKSRIRRLTGGVCSGEISITTGEEATLSVSGVGYYDTISSANDYVDPTNTAANPLIAQDFGGTTFNYDDSNDTKPSYHMVDETPMIPKDMQFAIKGTSGSSATGGSEVTLDISEMTIDLNWTQDSIDVITNAPGDLEHVNTRGAGEGVTGGITLTKASATEFDNLISDYESAEQLQIRARLVEVNGSRNIQFTMPRAQFGVESVGENGNLRNHDFDFKANRNLDGSVTGDNSLKIEYNV